MSAIPEPSKALNFGSGPAQLPAVVHEKLREALHGFKDSGLSLAEISHRDDRVLSMIDRITQLLRELLLIPNDYAVLLCNFPMSLHFSAVPLNLCHGAESVLLEMSGHWSDQAAREMERYAPVWRFQAAMSAEESVQGQSTREALLGSKLPGLVYYCDNETIDGIEWAHPPGVWYNGFPVALVADMSSNLLTRSVAVEAHSLILASLQKNLGLPGMSLAIVRHDVLRQARDACPRMLNYTEIHEAGSVMNTVPVMTLFVLEALLDWIRSEGGVSEMERRARQRAELMYSFIDASAFYINSVPKAVRSRINVPFELKTPTLTEVFLREAEKEGFFQLRGHRSKGGLRASLYNAMPVSGVERLVAWMAKFEQSGVGT